MEKDYISSDALIELEFIVHPETKIHYHDNFELLYVLNGSISLNIEEEISVLNPKDLVIVNHNRKHSYTGSEDLFIARFIISYSKIRELLSSDTILFWCNSTLEKSESYNELRKIIEQILNQHFVDAGKNGIYKTSLYYQLLHVITKNFLLTSADIKYRTETQNEDGRIQEIFQFIRANYQNPISLQDLADHFYLSTTYLSKYIKQKCDVSFTELINSVRLAHAMVDLIYSEQSIMKIAMSNGFASVAAYNKAFKEAYQMTPSQFRKKQINSKNSASDDADQKESALIKERLESFLNENSVQLQEENSQEIQAIINVNESEKTKWTSDFNQLINVGGAIDLIKSDFQEQIIYMKHHLGAKYVRFWDIYDPELHLDIHAPKDKINFSRLDSSIDFLVNNQLIPYIELGFKPIRLLKNTQNALMEVAREEAFETDAEMNGFFKEFLSHFIKRYGSGEVSKWYFEYWKKEDIAFSDLTYTYIPQTETGHKKYFHEFQIIAKAFRKILPDVRIGGGGFPVQHYGKKGFCSLLELWQTYDEYPDFLTFTGYPYQLEKEANVYYERKSTDMDFILHNLEIVRESIAESGFPDVPLHVSEYSLTLSNRNPINDHCAKGAYLLQNAIAAIGYADLFGHWLGMDIYADFYDSQRFLFGGCGLITKTGVPKPAFYALSFLKLLYKDIYKKEKNYLVTGNSRGSFRMICHNFKNLNSSYYLMDESKIEITSLPHLFEDNEALGIQVKINEVPNGIYAIKTSLVNTEYGSVQDEWKRFHFEEEMSLSEQEYFKRISTPKLLNTQITVNNHMLDFNIQLKANEFRYLHIYLI